VGGVVGGREIDVVGVLVVGIELPVVSGASCAPSGATDASTGCSSAPPGTCGCVTATTSVGRVAESVSRVTSAVAAPARTASRTIRMVTMLRARRVPTLALYPLMTSAQRNRRALRAAGTLSVLEAVPLSR
jgi:hypothetical protein